MTRNDLLAHENTWKVKNEFSVLNTQATLNLGFDIHETLYNIGNYTIFPCSIYLLYDPMFSLSLYPLWACAFFIICIFYAVSFVILWSFIFCEFCYSRWASSDPVSLKDCTFCNPVSFVNLCRLWYRVSSEPVPFVILHLLWSRVFSQSQQD